MPDISLSVRVGVIMPVAGEMTQGDFRYKDGINTDKMVKWV